MKQCFQMAGVLHAQQDADGQDFAPRIDNPDGQSPFLLVCEHASPRIPGEFQNLGLEAHDLQSHIAWDPGAFETAKLLSEKLDAALVYSTVSRLIYDCNRPPDAESAMPNRSEATIVPGNVALSDADRRRRVERFYRPFETLLSKTLNDRPEIAALATIHSFTPIYRGEHRPVEIGLLHDTDRRLTDALLQLETDFKVERNAPYGPSDGVMHTLQKHAQPREILNVMIEIRNDLIATPEQCEKMSDTLAGWLTDAFAICTAKANKGAGQ